MRHSFQEILQGWKDEKPMQGSDQVSAVTTYWTPSCSKSPAPGRSCSSLPIPVYEVLAQGNGYVSSLRIMKELIRKVAWYRLAVGLGLYGSLHVYTL
jgi:hypothetical protein